ncbi:glycosyltransferase [Alcaligenaceae bacterium]|nr:glycosyltransferase [Alcaligenaceae bacterium]
MPLISVVMSVYNGERFLAPAIESILNQSLSDFEFIIIDDGSADASLAVLNEYAGFDKRIRVISRENRGLISSLNEAIGLARGSWIARMDADDIALPTRFEKQMGWLRQTGADVCGGCVQLIGTTPRRVWSYHTSNEAIRIRMLFGSPFAHPTVIIRASVARRYAYNTNAAYVEDFDLWARLAMENVPMTNYPDVVLKYRIHSEQTTATKQQQQRRNMLAVFDEYSSYLLGDDFEVKSGYLLVANKQLEVTPSNFIDGLGFLKKLRLRFKDPENVVSRNAFIFLTRSGFLSVSEMMEISNDFSLRPWQKLILLLIASTGILPEGKIYRFLYRFR